jgi:hypothetical protein
MPKSALVLSNPLASGWRTSEGKLTGLAGGLYALGSVAEAVGWIPPGSTNTLMPALGLVATYVLGRTWLKAKAQTQAVAQTPIQATAPPGQIAESLGVIAAPPTPQASADPMAGLAQALQALNQARAIQTNLEGMARGILGLPSGDPAPAAAAPEPPAPAAAPPAPVSVAATPAPAPEAPAPLPAQQ